MTISEAFKSYSMYAFRMETLPIFRVAGERDDYNYFVQTGEARQNEELLSFIQDIENKTKSGIHHIRTRVLPPTSNSYIKFQVFAAYIPQEQAGAEFHFINEDDYLALPNEYNLKDFWLFDNKYLYCLDYTEEGEFVRVREEKDRAVIDSAIRLKELSVKSRRTIKDVIDRYL